MLHFHSDYLRGQLFRVTKIFAGLSAVDNASGVCDILRIGNLNSERKQGVQLHRTIPNQVLQRYTVKKLHSDKRVPVRLANVVQMLGGSEQKQPVLPVSNEPKLAGLAQLPQEGT